MVGSFSVVGSSVTDLYACPCFCFGSLPSCDLRSGVLDMQKSSIIKKHVPIRPGSFELRSPFLDSVKALSGGKNMKIQRKNRNFMIVNELAGQYEDNFEDVKATIVSYFTYKAVRTVLSQLYEMNPPQYIWFYDYVTKNKPNDGKRFIHGLAKEKQELAERVMITRLHLYAKWIKKCDHAAIYKEISDENLELMRQRLIETVIWPSDDTNAEKIG